MTSLKAASCRSYRLFCFISVNCALIGMLIGFTPVGSGAQEMDATDEGLEISGLVLDETKTKPGRDFYEYFTTYWREVKGLQYTITVSELPDATRGSFVFVKVNDTMVYQKRLNPRPDLIENAAKQAVRQVGLHMFKKLTAQQQLEEEFQF
jgi:curli production assembly/transport component CsgE